MVPDAGADCDSTVELGPRLGSRHSACGFGRRCYDGAGSFYFCECCYGDSDSSSHGYAASGCYSSRVQADANGGTSPSAPGSNGSSLPTFMSQTVSGQQPPRVVCWHSLRLPLARE